MSKMNQSFSVGGMYGPKVFSPYPDMMGAGPGSRLGIKRGNGKKTNGKRGKKGGKDEDSWQSALGGFYPVVSSGTREMAFVHAISSAGVAHALTRACSSGELENCGCDRSLRGMSPEGFQVKNP